jgi:hypothetical protein
MGQTMVKFRLLCASALALLGAATAASAQDVEFLQVKTNVAPFCATIAAASPTPLNLGSLVDTSGNLVASFSGPTSRDLGAYYCNAPATVTLSASPLTQTANTPVVDTANFTNRVDYVANLTWDDISLPANSTASAPASLATTEANTGNLIVSVSTPAVTGSRRPIAGDYAGVVTLTVSLN